MIRLSGAQWVTCAAEAPVDTKSWEQFYEESSLGRSLRIKTILIRRSFNTPILKFLIPVKEHKLKRWGKKTGSLSRFTTLTQR
jgi:hypothetical protein